MGIVWELWKARSQGRFDNNFLAAEKIISAVKDNCAAVFNGAAIIAKRGVHEDSFLRQLGIQLVPTVAHFVISKWLRPKTDYVKLNADGYSKGNPGLSGGGCLLRNSNGVLIWAVAKFYGRQTNMVAEAMAILTGLQRCVVEGRKSIEVESNSLTLVQVLKKEVATPWCIAYVVREIFHLLSPLEVTISHTYRGNNISVDFLANLGVTEQRKKDIGSIVERLTKLRGIVNMDKCGISSIHCRKF